jgi:predicted transposase YdaD
VSVVEGEVKQAGRQVGRQSGRQAGRQALCKGRNVKGRGEGWKLM